jgi:hypothetical protein
MTDISVAAPKVSPSAGRRKLIVIIGITALADWLLYKYPIGISVVLAVIALEGGVLVTNPMRTDRREVAAAAGVLLIALLPFVESPSIIAFAVLAAGASYFALEAVTAVPGGVYSRALSSGTLLVAGPLQIFDNLGRARRDFMQRRGAALSAAAFAAWIVPIALAMLFLALFVSANPLIERWFAELNLKELPSNTDFARVAFWMATIAVIWPFVCMSRNYHARVRTLLRSTFELPTATIPQELSELSCDATIMRSLVLFNVLFAVQTTLDLNYLWRGAALPGGMTYAEYAHRGTYPLIVTALLAAVLVIVAMRPGSNAERSPVIRALVLLWIGQNVMLVVSSILRLDLYVETYSLTYLRAAAFVWMLLVAIGLVLIVARIMLYRSNAWLVSRNLAALALTIYACGFVNFPGVIAAYNVAHSREISGQGERLDVDYLLSLGPQTIPALDFYIKRQVPGVSRQVLISRRDAVADFHLNDMTDWRGWSFRGFRLKRYLESSAEGTVAPWASRLDEATPGTGG